MKLKSQALQPCESSHCLVIIDPTIDVPQHLIDGVVPNTTVVVLDPQQESVPQVTQALKTFAPIADLHLVSHGTPGQLQWGNGPLTLANLGEYAAELQQWRFLLGEAASVFLYGCRIAAGKLGKRFVQQLSQMLGTGIAANPNLTGSSTLGGNWLLSYELPSTWSTYRISKTLPFTTTTLNTYPACLNVGFSTQSTYAAGNIPDFVSVGDFNGDSQADLVTANRFSNTVSVFLGGGSGGFSSQTTFATGTRPYIASVGDINGDSQADLVTANTGSSNISVLLGDGSGGFSNQTNFAVGLGPISVSIGDFNGDSQADLVTTNFFSNNISVLLGDGSGGFSDQTTLATGIGPFSISVGDFNSDSQADLVVGNVTSHNVSVLLGDGSGGFSDQTTLATGIGPYSLLVGDFNGDSQDDLVTANYYNDNISVLLGDGSGGFSSRTTYGVGNYPRSVSVGDFNGDSQADLITANREDDNVSVLLGDGSGGFSNQTTFAVGNFPSFVSVGDFNGDSQADFVTANAGDNNISVLLNTTIDHTISVDAAQLIEGNSGSQTLTFTVTRSGFTANTSSIDFTIAGTAINGSDFNNIGGTSGASTTTGTINFAAGETSKTITLDVLGDTNFEPQEMIAVTLSNATAAVNTTISTATATSTLLNDELFADFSVQSTFAAGVNPRSVSVGDFNGDSLADLVTASGGSRNVFVFLGDGSGDFSSQPTFAVGAAPRSISVGDFNGDSLADLVTANYDSNNVSVFLGDGSGGFSNRTTFAAGTRPNSASVGDFNGDNLADLVTANFGNDNVSVFLGDGSGGFSSQTTFAAGTSPLSVSVGDFNGDSQADLVTANLTSNNVSVFLGDGSGGFSSQTTFAAETGPVSVTVGDFNGDSLADLVTANFNSNNVSVLLGNGSGEFSSQTTFAAGSLPISVTVGDLNGDSQADLVTANFFRSNVSVHLGNGLGGFSSQTTFAAGGSPASVSVGDFNGDGLAEIAVANEGSNNISILSPNTTLVALDSSRNLVITDRSNAKADNLTLTTDGTNFTLTDPNNLLTHVISGATGNATNNITVPTTLVTGPQLVINTGGGNDIVSGSSQSETINGGLGADLLNGGGGDDVLTDGPSIGTVNPNAAAVDPTTIATTAFTPTSGWSSNDLFPRQLADVNGDGRADIVGFGNNAVAVALGQTDGTFGTAFEATNVFSRLGGGWSSNDLFPRLLADVNGDDRADIVGFGNNAVAVALGQTDGTFGTAFEATNVFSRLGGGWSSNDLFPRLLADVNGDDRADIVGFGNNAVAVALGQTDGTFGTAFVAANAASFTREGGGWSSNDLFPRQLADVNGDGRADIVGFGNNAVAVALGQTDGTFGTAFVAANAAVFTRLGGGWSSNDLFPRHLADINDDGRADIVGFGNNAVAVALGQADGTFGTAIVVNQGSAVNPDFTVRAGFSSDDESPRFVADVTGDGLAEIIGFGDTQVKTASFVEVNDYLLGEAGDDRLVGGAGNDLLTGGADADTFVFDINAADSGINRITDFNATEGDTLEIDQAAFGITNLSEITFDEMTGELFVAGTYNNTLVIFTGQSGFDVNTHITLV